VTIVLDDLRVNCRVLDLHICVHFTFTGAVIKCRLAVTAVRVQQNSYPARSRKICTRGYGYTRPVLLVVLGTRTRIPLLGLDLAT
jgi:hypothetical protein